MRMVTNTAPVVPLDVVTKRNNEAMTEPVYENAFTAMAAFEREADRRNNFCRICWGPLPECPGHQGYMEMFGPPPSDEEVAAYRADLKVRARGLERKQQALNAAAVNLGYDSIEDLVAKVGPDVG